MKRKQFLVEFVIVIGLAVLVAVLLLVAQLTTGQDGLPDTPVKISEIMTSNGTHPNADGVMADWIELANDGDSDADVSGYMLTDRVNSVRNALPQGTVIPAHGYLVVSCCEGEGEALYTGFSLSKSGNETVSLLSSRNIIVDRVVTQKMKKGQVMARNASGEWETLDYATPGFANSQEGLAAYTASLVQEGNGLCLTEAMSSNLSVLRDEDGEYSDWIEVTNTGDEALDLNGYGLSDKPGKPLQWCFPSLELAPGESVLVFASGKDRNAGELHTNFSLSAKGEELTLCLPGGAVCDQMSLPTMEDNWAWQRQEDGSFAAVMGGTPGINEIGTAASSLAEKIQISEVMADNTAGIRDNQGRFCDWIELQNIGSETVSLQDCWLSKEEAKLFDYRLPDISLGAGEFAVIYCDTGTETSTEFYTGFKLPNSGGSLFLTSPQGAILDSFDYEAAQSNESMMRLAVGDVPTATYLASPGFANDQEGYLKALAQYSRPEGLIINEVMPNNASYLEQSGGRYEDWVELYNASEEAIQLSEYFLSDDPEHLQAYALPERVLEPGEYCIVICSGDSTYSTKTYPNTDFKLNDQADCVYLTRKDGTLQDYLPFVQVPVDVSYGRMEGESGFFYFKNPSPNKTNTAGSRGVSEIPSVLKAEGIYSKDEPFTVEIQGRGTFYYTLDASQPSTRSQVYTEPISISKTTVLRVMAVEDGLLPSKTITRTYILDNHELPVLSIATASENLYGSNGIYVAGSSGRNYYLDMEKPCNMTLLDGENSINVDCALRMHGAGTRKSSAKKSFKVVFRSQYGPNELVFPGLFEGSEVSHFQALVIRSGEDCARAIIREELFGSLADELNTDMLSMDSRYVVLYVAGEYFGIYALKERQDENFYAAHYNVSPDSVEVYNHANTYSRNMGSIKEYALKHDLNDPEAYAYLEDHVDMLSMIDWCIFEAYGANTDIPGNVRYFYSAEGDHKLRYALFDMDWTLNMKGKSLSTVLGSGDYHYNSLPVSMLRSKEFRKLFCQRLAYVLNTTLSEEHVLQRIDELAALIASEVPRDSQRWGKSQGTWENSLEKMRTFVKSGRAQYLLDDFARYCHLTQAEKEEYYGEEAMKRFQ